MAEKAFFTLEPTEVVPGKYMIKPDYEVWGITHIEGSGNVLPARVMGLTYAQYLRFCRDLLNAELVGKYHKYPYPLFDNVLYVREFITLLNKRATLIKWEKDNPDWTEHAIEVIKKRLHL
jgi:hypothetical protein